MMPDKEKVIKGLEYCEVSSHFNCYDKCPYWDGGTHCAADLAQDALAMLKEQEEKIEHLNNITLEYEKEVFRLQTLLKEQEAQRDYEASVEMAEYCERYEQTYNPEDGSM